MPYFYGNNLGHDLRLGHNADSIIEANNYFETTTPEKTTNPITLDFILSTLNSDPKYNHKREIKFIPPIDSKVVSDYGIRSGRLHRGIDLKAAYGSSIGASESGVVIDSGYQNGYGNFIDIRHSNRLVTRYAHLSRSSVKFGDKVSKGQLIALSGNSGHVTGPHLHFEVRLDDKAVNPKRFL